MRDILFRAKRIDNDEWAYGYYIKTHDYLDNREIHLIVGIDSTSFPANEITDANEVNLETLGQYTGLTDKNDVRIFEGDIVRGIYDSYEFVYVVVWDNDDLGFLATNGKEKYGASFQYLLCCEEIEVIGNVYNNPELLEDKK